MKTYGDDIDAILDILESKYHITEEILEQNDLLNFVTDRNNLEEVKDFVIWAGRYREDFNSKIHRIRYMIKILKSKKKHYG